MASRPTVAPDFATDADHPAGVDDWSGKANKVQPSAGRIGSGFTPGEKLPTEWLNWILNNHGSWLDYAIGIQDGRNKDLVVLEDDFTGDSLDRGKWIGPASAAISFPVEDPAIGACRIDTNTSGVNGSISAQSFKPGTLDFHLTAIIRCTGFATAATYDSLLFGLVNLGSPNDTIWMRFVRAPGFIDNVQIAYDAHPSGSEIDSGVAPNPANFSTYEIIRQGSTLTFLIDGVQVHQAITFTRDLADTQLTVSTTAIGTSGIFDVDLVRAVFYRGGSGAGTALAAPSAHAESGYSAVTDGIGSGHEYVDVSWVTPFGAATGVGGYRVEVEIYSPTGQVVGWSLTNKTTTGFRVNFSAAFDGEIHWEAK